MNKKIIALILCIFCLASVLMLASCGGTPVNTNTNTDTDVEISIVLDLDGGEIDYLDEFELPAGQEFELPDPIKDGYNFDGWYVDDEKVESPFAFDSDTVLVAKWTAIEDGTDTDSSTNTDTNGGNDTNTDTNDTNTDTSDTNTDTNDTNTDTSDEEVEYTVTLTLNGGTLNGYNETIFTVTKGEEIDLGIPKKDGYSFIGWFADGEDEAEFPFAIYKDTEFVAEWKKVSGGNDEPDTDTDTDTETDGGEEDAVYFTITFDPNGGTFNGELTIQVKQGDKIPEPEKPSKSGAIFSGWYAGSDKASRWDFANMTVSKDVTLKAWFSGGSGCAHEETTPVLEKSYPADCENNGRETVKCNKCKLETFTNIPKLGHDLKTEVVPETCATEGYTREYCLREGCTKDRTFAKIPATGNHTWGKSYVTIIEPTMYVGGEEAKFCEVCNTSQNFDIPSIAEMQDLLWDLDIGNYKYTGGKYVDEPFVNISKTAGISSTSYYTVCVAGNAIDGAAGSYWCADTLADGASFSDVIEMTFAQSFDIGMIKFTVPHYSAWELGDDCYVAYNLEAFIDGKWEPVAILSDKNATPAGNAAAIIYEFEEPINTDKLKISVAHASRYAPAMIYEIETMAFVEEKERITTDLISSSAISSSGKYNSWATGTETLMDGSYDTFWQSNYNHKATVGEIYAQISFPDDLFVTSVQFVVSAGKNQQHSIYYLDEDGETWVKACTYNVVKGKDVSLKGDSNGDGVADGVIVKSKKGENRALFTCDIVKFTKGIKLVIDSDAEAWAANVYEFTPYTAVEQAVVQKPGNLSGIATFNGCAHNSFKEIEKVAPGCATAGYTLMQCYGCGFECKTDATDAYGHLWSQYNVALAAEGTAAGTKESVCLKGNCDAKRTTAYYNDFDDPKITTYKNNAPAAWAQTLDDGNYLGTYDWLIPKMKQYGWKASVMLSITFCDAYVSNWQQYLKEGVLDIGSHSYTHGGYYSGQISENALLSDVHNAHYWFMNNFHGQRILGFATPNGATSTGTSEYVTSLMASARNGGASTYFYNRIEELQTNGYGQSPYVGSIAIDEETGEVVFTQATNKSDGEPVWVSTRRAWGNMNSYISKADQSEGSFVFITKDGALASKKYEKVTQVPVIDETTGEQKIDEEGNPVWEVYKDPVYKETTGGYIKQQNGSYVFAEEKYDTVLIKLPNAYVYVPLADLGVNYVYDEETNALKNVGIEGNGSYKYVEITDDKGNIKDNYFEWSDNGSYDLVDGEFVFRNDNDGEYKLIHTALGSYEKAINQIISVGGMTVECLHEIGNGGTIWSTYTSTNSKYQYLAQTGVWVASYTELIQYMKEQLSATLTLIERTDESIRLTLTDTLDDYMFNFPLTIEVDIDDSWVQYGVKATQAGKDIEFFVKNGYVYVNAVPDAGEIVITPATLCTDGTVNHTYDEGVEKSPATCTKDGEILYTCSSCGFELTKKIPASHNYSEFVLDGTTYKSTCQGECGHVIEKPLVDITGDILGPVIPTVSGDVVEGSHHFNLIDGNLAEAGLLAAGTALEFEYTFDPAVSFDFVSVVGFGDNTFKVEVVYESEGGEIEYVLISGEEDPQLYGTHTFAIDSTKNVVSLKFTQTTFESTGSWAEIIIYQNPVLE